MLRESTVRQASIGIIIGIIAGIIIGATIIRPHIAPELTHESTHDLTQERALDLAVPSPENSAEKPIVSETPEPTPNPVLVHWRMTSVYAGSLPGLGDFPKRIETAIDEISNHQFKIDFHEPGRLIPPEEMFEAVRSGAIQAGFSSPAQWAEKAPALSLFSSIPFGPNADEYLAWVFNGGGLELFNQIYEKHGIHSIICGATSANASGWFNKPITTADDLKGLHMRINGLGARVMEKLGVTTEYLMNSDIVVAMESGAIDAAEFSQPATDFTLGLHRTANILYFPGWHQPATLFDLIINKEAWEELSIASKAQIEAVCGDNVWRGLVASDARQFAALKHFTKLGVQIKTWPHNVLSAFRRTWQQVVEEESKKDKTFKQVWLSIEKFREKYAIWHELSAP